MLLCLQLRVSQHIYICVCVYIYMGYKYGGFALAYAVSTKYYRTRNNSPRLLIVFEQARSISEVGKLKRG